VQDDGYLASERDARLPAADPFRQARAPGFQWRESLTWAAS
jgi:hypothetical protein